ncbi:ATP-dependent nuclease [Solimonas variicoloris]|uniref:ATP-dependent nuclease n=1 Tax=Solimonas variicoloris TaxID=254408 RepID=UPI0003A61464|nr:ATP-binding protein [Solimonas variicoloris]
MSHRYSDVERKNLGWFTSDPSRASLFAVTLKTGSLRGLKPCEIRFQYPISAIAGKNGCGKSTLLAAAACAFHNGKNGWKLPDRRLPYYTFSDFFIQSGSELAIDGIEIEYEIFHNRWKPHPQAPDGVGALRQVRSKKRAGKWNDYDKRVRRPVAYLGIERIVPPSERSVYKSYRYRFSKNERAGWEDNTRTSVSRTLSLPYDDFEIHNYGKYRLPAVKCNGNSYTGFNMGAGEKALFELFAAIWAAPEGTLFLVDEIELGLHESAQRNLIRELSRLALVRKIQIICTTHSATILSCLPPEGRFLVTASNEKTSILTGVAAAYAAGRLADRNSGEITAYVEDDVAASLLKATLGFSFSARTRIVAVGSHSAVISRLAARFTDDPTARVCAFLDGDQRPTFSKHEARFKGLVAQRDHVQAADWFAQRTNFLPGESSPERYVLTALEALGDHAIAEAFSFVPEDTATEAVAAAVVHGAHEELFVLAERLGEDQGYVWKEACKALIRYKPELHAEVSAFMHKLLLN